MLRDPEQVRHWAVLGQREYGGRGLGVAVGGRLLQLVQDGPRRQLAVLALQDIDAAATIGGRRLDLDDDVADQAAGGAAGARAMAVMICTTFCS